MLTNKRSSRSSRSRSAPAKRSRGPVWLRLLLILIVAVLLIGVLPAPWALDIGGHFSPLGEWDGYGPVQASNGGHYLMFTHLHGGVTNGDDSACGIRGCHSLTGNAQVCTSSGQRYTFDLTGTVHGWLSTNQALTDITLTGGTPKALPRGTVLAFRGTWHGPVLPVATTNSSFTEVFTPAGAMRTSTSAANGGTAHGKLRFGSATGFDQACNALASSTR